MTTLSSTTTTVAKPVGTAGAYIDTILRHHNAHRANASVPNLVWSDTMAQNAQTAATGCVYQHNLTPGGGGYGQNIGAGYLSTQMGAFITEGMYNNEVNNYPTPYGANNPDLSNFSEWGHYSQIVWGATTEVGCYTADCSATGLTNTAGTPPYFTVCNYYPAGNVVGQFSQVGTPLGGPTIHANYECTDYSNCEGPTT
ncbi:PR-1-like protein [Myriangium duriaei CBS 260.36]|uniref:PR-1-like protein n=1 Tax=Myriangium duriaei CBS 260.36 TaxID=1168546 RepID=A0A9P4ISR6_9PEZI|nr:PR-1-like protein [Myriangium duriaei CBS 260.36]